MGKKTNRGDSMSINVGGGELKELRWDLKVAGTDTLPFLSNLFS